MTSHPFSLERNRGLFLGFFFFSNFLIAYSALPLGFKLTLGLFGILVPLYVGLRTSAFPKPSAPADHSLDLKFPLPLWILLAGVGLALFLRFYKLTTLFCWPTLDEGWNGILALGLSKDWNWRFFYTFGDAPPLPVWCAALLFKVGASPALALWLPSAMVSCLTVAAGYFASRQYFSKSFSLVCGGLLAFGHWPLFMGRFCHQGIWLPLWICGFLYLWGRFQNAKQDKDRKIWAAVSGLGLGLGSFTFTPWIGAAAVLFLWVFWTLWVRSQKTRSFFLLFTAGCALALLPFLLAVLREGYGHHIRSLSPWGGWFKEFQVVTGFFKYFAVMVWGAYEKDPAYVPVWGGFLNPLLGAFFFLGIAEMLRRWRLGIIQWVGAFFLLFLLPGALSPNLEAFRVAQVMPILLVIVAFGVHPFLASLTPPRRTWALAGILAFTGGFDFNQLSKPYRDPQERPGSFGRPLKSLERYGAYGILKERNINLILSDLDPNSFNDPTLLLMTHPMNAAVKGGAVQGARLGLLPDSHYRPFLQKRFPSGEFFELTKRPAPESGGNILMVLDESSLRAGFPWNWTRAHAPFLQADLARFDQNSGKLEKPVSILASGYPLVKGDPFLESVYWDKMAAYAYENLDYEAQLKCYQMAVTRGYPTADLYFKLGQMYLVGKRMKEAREAFVMATRSPLDRTQAGKVLEWMISQQGARPSTP